MLPPPKIAEHGGVLVVRDDRMPGGTKRRGLDIMLRADGAEEFVYAGPAYGYAQIALAYACRAAGRRATLFVAARREMHPRTAEALMAGAAVYQVPNGYLSHVRARAAAYCAATGARCLPFGLDCEAMLAGVAAAARSLKVAPREVWAVSGSGTLIRGLQRAWPAAAFHSVLIGKRDADVGRAAVHIAPEKFEESARVRPPFPSCPNYDAKAWRFVKDRPGALFWNVGA